MVGSARMTSNEAISGVVRFTIPGLGTAAVGESQAVTGVIVPVRRRADGFNTGVAVANAGAEAATLLLTLRNSAGIQVSTVNLSLAANGHAAKFLDQLFPAANTNSFDGTLAITVTGNGKVAVTALELGNVPGQFTTLPVTPLR